MNIKRSCQSFVEFTFRQYARMFTSDRFCAILCLHRVAELDRTRLRFNDHLKVSPDFLEQLIRKFKKRGYTFISLDEVADGLRNNKPLCKALALTFDDGYASVFENGYPVLASENVPGMVYVATGLAKGEGILWWDVLEDYLLNHEKIQLPNGKCVQSQTAEEKNAVFLGLRDWVFSLPYDKVPSAVAKFCQMRNDELVRYSTSMADDDMLKRFSPNKLISLGCHTHRHIPCGLCSDEEAKKDIVLSIMHLKKMGCIPRHFAFPYGMDVLDPLRFRDFFCKNGLQTCVTTFPGIIRNQRSDPYFLPRIAVLQYDGFSERDLYDARAALLRKKLRAGLRLLVG